MAGGDKRCTAGLTYNTVVKPDNLFTAGSYAEPAAKTFITAGYSTRRGPIGHEPAVICITAGYLKTVGEGPGGELTFCSSVSFINSCLVCLDLRVELMMGFSLLAP